MATFTGKHLINAQLVGSGKTFQSDNPSTGEKNPTPFFNATPDFVNQAVEAAQEAYGVYSITSLKDRANFLRIIADEIEARAQDLTATAMMETGLPSMRLEGERGRTTAQLRFFADYIEAGDWLGARIDEADPERQPLPKPDIRAVNKALGPIAVFGASNFPLAFSTAGGDTASALAAGCSVVVKAHDAHPATCEIVACAIAAAIEKCAMPRGVFNQIQGGDYIVGQTLVKHPSIKAVGFTGSIRGGRALFDIAVSRPEPIAFYGELGSNNPVFLLANTMANNAETIASNWAVSLTMGAGQFCTNPGVIVAVKGPALEAFKEKAVADLKKIAAQAMLTKNIAKTYQSQGEAFASNEKVECLITPTAFGGTICDLAFEATAGVFAIDAKTWMSEEALAEEIFGAAAFIVECENDAEMMRIASSFHGQLTATIQMTDADNELAGALISILEDKAGRVLVNGFPTGVEVCHSMIHGGPYPASTDSRSTSVGSKAIERFVRPVSYQNLPDALLPDSLQRSNPLGIKRLVNGGWSK